MDGLASTLVRAAAADVAAHGIVDVSVRRVGFVGKQRGSGHDLPWLAIAALRNIFLHPGFLHGVAPIGGKTFDGGHFLARNTRNRGDTGTRRFAVDMHRTSSAKGHATAELRAGHVQRVAEHPEQWHVRADIYGLGLAVQRKGNSHGDLLKQGHVLHQLPAENPRNSVPAYRAGTKNLPPTTAQQTCYAVQTLQRFRREQVLVSCDGCGRGWRFGSLWSRRFGLDPSPAHRTPAHGFLHRTEKHNVHQLAVIKALEKNGNE